MKSERRHEIQENSLAHFLEGIFESAKPHANMIGGVILALLLGYLAYIILNQESSTVEDAEWSAVYTTLDQSFRVGEDDVKRQEIAQEFATISTDYGDTRPALWAEYFYGQQNLTQASDVAFSDPQSAAADIERAITSFQKVYDSSDLPVLKVKALWGLADAYELQATKESLGKAKSSYEEIMVIWPDTNTSRAAEERIERLDNAGIDSFYAWYRDQDFAAHAAEVERENRAPLQGTIPGLEPDGPGGNMFDNPTGTTPGAANPLFTPSMDLNAPGDAQPKPSSFTEKEEAATAEKAAEEAKPEGDKPAEPMTEAAAEPEKKAEEAAKPEAEPMKEAAATEEKPAEEEKAEEPAKEEAASDESN
ncbi:hypothetical protein [Bremerella cremea]|uniref:tetratricopeptide repeat protein n=1 Tax=Bremerella cremea TaxID=1031537 RepID=UPI0031F005C1